MVYINERKQPLIKEANQSNHGVTATFVHHDGDEKKHLPRLESANFADVLFVYWRGSDVMEICELVRCHT